jgi:hypothetical protein
VLDPGVAFHVDIILTKADTKSDRNAASAKQCDGDKRSIQAGGAKRPPPTGTSNQECDSLNLQSVKHWRRCGDTPPTQSATPFGSLPEACQTDRQLNGREEQECLSNDYNITTPQIANTKAGEASWRIGS